VGCGEGIKNESKNMVKDSACSGGDLESADEVTLARALEGRRELN
jgi:recombinational DNA repair protein RecR